ncbi:recombinase family protein [Streptomyces sp. NPDC006872]|uniref:recombinase family protein n=1 Tax=Streptomyces sp. NPDC006872 TaxID=3155720 RepID=UPI0033FDA766
MLDRQIRALTEAGCIRIFADKKSGKNAEREELPSCPACASGIGFTSLHESLDTTTPGGRLVFHVFATLAEFIRELIVQGTNEGLDAARARGARLGRPPTMTDEQVRHARDLLARPENTVASIAKLLGVSRNTIYN